MIEPATIEGVLDHFERTREIYTDFLERQLALLREFVKEGGPEVQSITGRVKERESLRRKILDPASSYRSLDEVPDLVGIRIVTYFVEDVEAMAEILGREFRVLAAHLPGQGEGADPGRFGYQSRHYQVGLRDERLKLIEYRRFKGFQAEVQVRTVLQQAWAELSGRMWFRALRDVPREHRRRMGRVVSLLELADNQLDGIRPLLLSGDGAVRDHERSFSHPVVDSPAVPLHEREGLGRWGSGTGLRKRRPPIPFPPLARHHWMPSFWGMPLSGGWTTPWPDVTTPSWSFMIGQWKSFSGDSGF
ncbi:MAG: RelA/SpoT domain-containing protein [Magnetococcales bacterium]|nr:RelA/SpoT domain-containing protein [Magnetococcales bacterium]